METKARILAVSENLFSEVGFDNARVDDIAKGSGVNKALIYYYFTSKEEILETLFASLIDDVKKILIKSVENTPDISQGDNYRQLFNQYIHFVAEKRKIIKIAIAESTKTSSNLSVVMELGNLIINAEIENIRNAYKRKGLKFPRDMQELLVTEFFTGLMPLFSYAIYKDDWEKFYNITEEELQEKLYRSFKKTHLAAHM